MMRKSSGPKRMLPSFSPQIGRSGGIFLVKSDISWCVILWNHAHESLLQYFTSNGCCLNFPHKSVEVEEFPLWNHSYQNAKFCQIMRMRAFFSTSQRKFLHFHWFGIMNAWFHKGNSSTSTDFEGKLRQHPSELKYWRRLSCAWFDKIRHYEMHDFTKEFPPLLLTLKENEGNIRLSWSTEEDSHAQ